MVCDLKLRHAACKRNSFTKAARDVLHVAVETHLKRLICDASASAELVRSKKRVLPIDVRNAQAIPPGIELMGGIFTIPCSVSGVIGIIASFGQIYV